MFQMKRDEKNTADVYMDAMFAMVAELPLVLVEADLGTGIGSLRFREQLPDHYVEVGISEANAVNVAAGLSANGFIPVVHSLAPFITRRAYDALVLSIAYSGLNCKVIGDRPGLYSELNGGTHFSVEDMGIMRNIPGFKVVEATDNAALAQLLPQVLKDPAPVYLRLTRKPYVIYDEEAEIIMGRANTLREGKDITIITHSVMAAVSLVAADILKEKGISARVIDMHTIKPLDVAAVEEAIRMGPVFTVENHSTIGGLGSAVAEVMAEHGNAPKLTRIGLADRFGVVGFMETMLEELGLRPEDVAAAIQAALR
jgi:transketolase